MPRREAELRMTAAADWLVRSHEATGLEGSAAYYDQLGWLRGRRAWGPAYPETTGYIVPTLLDVACASRNRLYAKHAINMADWLLTLQDSDGWLPGGVHGAGVRKPSVFNTGQIIKGFLSAHEHSGRSEFLEAARMGAEWLCRVQDRDGAWRQHAYQEGFSPSYYAEVCQPMAAVADRTGDRKTLDCAVKGLAHILDRQEGNGAIRGWGFRPGEAGLTHTIGYTIAGLLESARILGSHGDEFWQCGKRAAEALLDVQQVGRGLAGAYDAAWRPVDHFVCLTGNAQVALCWLRIYDAEGGDRFLKAAVAAMEVVLRHQFRPHALHQNAGGIPGARPQWAGYMRFKYPNWAAKYFLDAMILLDSITARQAGVPERNPAEREAASCRDPRRAT